MLHRAAWIPLLVGWIALAFAGLNCTRASGPARSMSVPSTKAASAQEVSPAPTPPAARKTIIGVVRAAAPDAPEAATVEADGVVYKVVKDENGKTVAREAKDRKAEIKGTVEGKDGAKWITVLSAKLGAY